ncbi:MAG: hypothetical protein HYU97_05970 [Deltaproteobacteria bacterium]|nr:hypothetical protein [Deltaproteobacteria bacterium]
MLNKIKNYLFLGLIFTCVACGGGQSNNNNPGNNPTPPPASPPPPPPMSDFDQDGAPDDVDSDDDNDGFSDEQDALPFDANEWVDTDGDGVGNNADTDDDNDGIEDLNDPYPNCDDHVAKVYRGNLTAQTLDILANGNYCAIDGDVMLRESPINSLAPLAKITQITGHLTIGRTPNLHSFEGLNNLIIVGKDLVIGPFNTIDSLDAFQNLNLVQGNLYIGENILTYAGQFPSLIYVGKDLQILGNSNLTTLSGFNRLLTVGETMGIFNNPHLQEISGFNQLNTFKGDPNFLPFIKGEVAIAGNPQLTSVSGFSQTASLTRLDVSRNQALIEITGFTSLKKVQNRLRISYNDNLAHFDGLGQLTTVGGEGDAGNGQKFYFGKLIIEENRQLTSLAGLRNLSYVGQELTIYENRSLGIGTSIFVDPIRGDLAAGLATLRTMPQFLDNIVVGEKILLEDNR